MVQIAIVESMPPEQKVFVYHKLLFLLNADFPHQDEGEPMHDKWSECEVLSSNVTALLKTHKWLQDEIGYPIQLSEISTRCAWYVLGRDHTAYR